MPSPLRLGGRPQAPAPHDHDQGLQHDLQAIEAQRSRRQAVLWLGALAGYGALPLVGCGGGGDAGSSTSNSSSTVSSDSTSTSTTTTNTSTSSCSVINEETAGPYPGDGSNTANGSVANALALSGIVRSDIRSSVGSASGTAAGLPLTITLKLVNVNNSCASLAGYAVYLWHCTRDGKYSLYSSGVTGENYLRGVQETDSNGELSFTTIFPGCYSGRMPHMHFEVYRSLTTATSYSNKLKTSQIAFDRSICSEVYSSVSGYSASVSNLAAITFATDNVFSDGYTLELASLSGNTTDGYTATLTVGISV
ncbi:intradiol ring-cleavage dioxygenase [Aquabacterium sp.]|jgi:protocatechuate 3,4-dioxygenase beta subunit|uniref:dioxygenase family protein n=1 Tax=Aquabacterium sp. TaxID=1872578 RepID=UPI0025C3183D|nr:intradiol ring-cleavage dioxygenase [Aquabacterium sp.]